MKRRGILTLATACVALIGGAVSAPTSATAQLPDIIVIDGKTEDLLSEPLGRAFAGHPMLREYFERHSRGGVCSALWRGCSTSVSISRCLMRRSSSTALPRRP